MSIVRYSPDSDVYLYEHCHGFIVCQECKLGGSQNFDGGKAYPGVRLFSYLDAHSHLLEHRAAGHKVPDYAIAGCDSDGPLAKSLCDVPDCGMFSTRSYPVIVGGEQGSRKTCKAHHDAAGEAAYDDWLRSEHRRLGKLP